MKINIKRLHSSALVLAAFCGSCASLAAQAPAPPQPTAAPTSRTPSAMMQPALETLRQTLETLRPDKWKASGAMRDETETNISSIRRDLETTLPPLLAAADAAPGSVARSLPAFRNIEALYDVLLRVAEAAEFSAPGQQNAALEQARAGLEDGRRAFGDQLHSAAVAQEQQVRSLQAALRAVPPVPAPTAAVCPPAHPVKKRKARRKPAKKPAPAPANTQSKTPASH